MTRCPPRVKCRGVIPAVSHVMLQSDTLAQEFNEILNLVEIFAPFQPLDPAVVFYAPLRNNTRDLRLNPDTFQRNSEAWYLDGSGIYRRSLANQARFENARLLMESAKTNKCTNYNTNPDPALTNIRLTGDASAIVRRVQNVSELANAGLLDICPDGNVLEFDNTASSGGANCIITGRADNLNQHTISAWALKIGAPEVRLQDTYGQGIQPFVNTSLERITSTYVPINVAGEFSINAAAGGKCQFILNQLEESIVATSPIVTEGTAGQRAIDFLSYADPVSWFNQSAGMALINARASFDSSLFVDGNYTESLFSLFEDRFNLLFLRSPAAQGPNFRSQMSNSQTAQGASINFAPGDSIQIAVRWNRSAPAFQIGHKLNNNTWVWGTEITSNLADFAIGSEVYVHYLPSVWPSRLSDAIIYNEDKGRAWIEDNY